MPFNCKGLCYKDRRFTTLTYKDGAKLCTVCQVFVALFGNRCPCCSAKVRMKAKFYKR